VRRHPAHRFDPCVGQLSERVVAEETAFLVRELGARAAHAPAQQRA